MTISQAEIVSGRRRLTDEFRSGQAWHGVIRPPSRCKRLALASRRVLSVTPGWLCGRVEVAAVEISLVLVSIWELARVTRVHVKGGKSADGSTGETDMAS